MAFFKKSDGTLTVLCWCLIMFNLLDMAAFSLDSVYSLDRYITKDDDLVGGVIDVPVMEYFSRDWFFVKFLPQFRILYCLSTAMLFILLRSTGWFRLIFTMMYLPRFTMEIVRTSFLGWCYINCSLYWFCHVQVSEDGVNNTPSGTFLITFYVGLAFLALTFIESLFLVLISKTAAECVAEENGSIDTYVSVPGNASDDDEEQQSRFKGLTVRKRPKEKK